MFVHLHVHGPFSFLDGGSSLEALVERAAALDMPALALTDHDNLSGAVKFHALARDAGIKPIQGVEVTLENSCHLTLLAEGPAGYRSLCRLLTAAHRENPRRRPRVSRAHLRAHTEGVIALSGCRRGEVPSLLLTRQYSRARAAAEEYISLWGRKNFYLELQNTLAPGDIHLNSLLCQLGAELKIRVAATNNVHYAATADFVVHDTLTCVRTLTKVQEIHPERHFNDQNYLKSRGEMDELFARCPEAVENTWRIAERCRPALEPGAFHFPAFALPSGHSAPELLRQLAYRGAHKKCGAVTPRIRARLEHELKIINALGYPGYFLVVWDLAQYARREKIRFAGRGSAADSFVAYCLGITEVDSLARGLLFERFMSLERAQKPDIDIDFDARHRDQVAGYVSRKYGEEHVAHVATYNTFRARSALRDLGKALGLPEEEIGPLAKLTPWVHADGIRAAIARYPELRGSGLDRKKFELLLDLCGRVAGFPRFLGTHLGGIVVSREPVADLSPVQEAAKGVSIVQFDKDDVEELGLVKLDLLSLRTMSAVEDTVRAIKDPSFDYDNIPLDDTATFERISRGDTVGVFQLESPSQRALQGRLGASRMEDIVASVAIIRPGPIRGNMVEPYINRRHGKEPVTYLHPRLEPILAKTYGVVLFQEQVIEIATAIAGFTPGESDRLRKVMTHARSQKLMDEIGEEFVAKTIANGIDRETAEAVLAMIAGYAGYGFCEAHAAAFATTGFKTAYLLQHYPAEFYAAILSNQPMGYYPPHVICNEARRRGIAVLPPDVNRSTERFEIEDGNIRISLSQVKGLSRAGIRRVLDNRPFVSFADFVARTKLDRPEYENLIRCGALDAFEDNRRRMLALLPRFLMARKTDGGAGETGLLPGSGLEIRLPDFTEWERYVDEFEILRLDPGGHVMARFRQALEREGYKSTRDVERLREGTWVKMAGVLLRPHRPPTRSGKITVFLSLEDEFGLMNVTVFEDVYQRCGEMIFAPQRGLLQVEGYVQRRGRAVSVTARRLSVKT